MRVRSCVDRVGKKPRDLLVEGATRLEVATERVSYALQCANNTQAKFDMIKTYQQEAAAW